MENQKVIEKGRKNRSLLRQQLLEKQGHRCAVCGQENVPLEIHMSKSLNEGGQDSLENAVLLCPNCHRMLHQKMDLREFEFVNYILQLLGRNPNYRNVRVNAQISKKKSLIADLIAEAKENDNWHKIVIECKSQSSFTSERLKNVMAQMEAYQQVIGDSKLILALPGKVSPKYKDILERQKVTVWDLDYISRTFQEEIPDVEHPVLQSMFLAHLAAYSKSPEEELIDKLKACRPGKTDAMQYQNLVGLILERLFCPPLSTPITEVSDASKLNRRDFILSNYSDDKFWSFLRSRYLADHIVVDAKNYSGKVKKKDVLQIANYLKPHGAGLFALIISRNGGDNGCFHTIREVWAMYNKIIIVLTDDDVIQMLLSKSSGGQAENIIRQKIEDFRLSL